MSPNRDQDHHCEPTVDDDTIVPWRDEFRTHGPIASHKPTYQIRTEAIANGRDSWWHWQTERILIGETLERKIWWLRRNRDI